MANGNEKSSDFYSVLGLDKECTASDLRIAYKKLAMRWHPDRCSASGNSKFVEEAKKKFQDIHQAYSVLSDENKRFMYDIGVYDSDDDDNGMGDFLNEMVVMMNETKPNENGGETFEELQQLFDDMFPGCEYSNSYCGSSSSSSSSQASFSYTQNANSISSQNSSIGNAHTSSGFSTHFQNFCVGTGGTSTRHDRGEAGSSKRRGSRRMAKR